MEQLKSELKGRFLKADIRLLDEEIIEVSFKQAKDSVIIQKQKEKGRYMVSYPKLVVDERRRIKQEETTVNNNILIIGVIGILKQVERHGKVMPEF